MELAGGRKIYLACLHIRRAALRSLWKDGDMIEHSAKASAFY